MAIEEDHFPRSLPIYQTPPDPYIFEDSSTVVFSSPDYSIDGSLDIDLTNVRKKPSLDTALPKIDPYMDTFSLSPPQGSGSGSQSHSLGTSESSSGGLSIGDRETLPARISIPADHTYLQPALQPDSASKTALDKTFTEDDFFDYDKAASSPSKGIQHDASGVRSLPIRNSHNAGFRVGNFQMHHTQPTYAQSPGFLTPLSDDPKPQFVDSTMLHNSYVPTEFSEDDPAAIPTSFASDPSQLLPKAPELQISNLPRTQRVETQMPVSLTMYPMPPGVSHIHFPPYTMARSKLVADPPPIKAPSTLELSAHCVCATAMEDPERKKQALERAADANSTEFRDAKVDGTQPRSLQLADDDPKKPMNGAFVFICDQCIQRENKRLGRKKVKNENEEAVWLQDQPKRIIVFNKAETMEWQSVQSYEAEDTGDEASLRADEDNVGFPEDAMQVRFPMRIQCYSRHHGEKLGYRVIFTIKDWEGRLVAQAMTNASIITDDHKAQHPTRLPSSMHAAGYYENQPAGQHNFISPTQSAYAGMSLGSRNSISSPDLQSLQLSHHMRGPQSQGAISISGDRAQSSIGVTSSRHGSRPASPSMAMAPQNKRRKGSSNGHAKLRSELMMTKISRNNPKSPTGGRGSTQGAAFGASHAQHPYSPNYNHTYRYPSSAGFDSVPSTPGASQSNFHQRSQSTENFQNYLPDLGSVPSSAWQSQAASAESSPQPYTQPLTHPQPFNPSIDAMTSMPNVHGSAVVRKVTPTDGPCAGGIEVTCLGEGFTRNSIIFFGDAPAATTSFWSPNALVCVLPPARAAGHVHIAVSDLSEISSYKASQDPVHFRYNDNNENELMRQTVHLFQRQFSGNSMEAHEFTQKLLASIEMGGKSLSLEGVPPSSPQAMTTTMPHEDQVPSRDLENVVIKCLELVDLDEKPKRVDLNERRPSGQTMLHLAVLLNFYRLLAGLLARGVDVDTRDNNGMTPMHMASLHGNLKMIRKLRSSGADPTIRSLDGKRPADLAPTQQTRRTIDDWSCQAPFVAKEPSSYGHLSRASSIASLRKVPDAFSQRPGHPDTISFSPTSAKMGEANLRSLQSGMAVPWSSQPRDDRLGPDPQDLNHIPKDQLSPDAAFGPTSPALSAWKDQISAQIQQLQQNLQRAMPLMPTLPDYQAYPVMRRISSLVPHRMSGSENSNKCTANLKAAEYHWWELITGPSSAPPAYEAIYPAQGTHDHDNRADMTDKVASSDITYKNGDTQDDPCSDQPIFATVNIGSDTLTKQQQEQIRHAHARKVKKLRSDRTLFFFWIPLLLLILAAMLWDRALGIWNFGYNGITLLRHSLPNPGEDVV